MKVTTKSLPANLQELVTGTGTTPRSVEFQLVEGGYVELNSSHYGYDRIVTRAITSTNPASRGYYLGDDGEPNHETLTEYHGAVAVRERSMVTLLVPSSCWDKSITLDTTVSAAPKNMNPAVAVAMDAFLDNVQALINKDYENNKYTNAPILTLEYGRKFVRVVKQDKTGGRSVHCFIDVATGDVYKAASYKQVAEGIRGNILACDVNKYGVGVYGANYR